MNWLEQVSIVLVEPQNPGNVGMVCRAMKNMGLHDLRLVNPCPTDHPEALKFAVSARDLLESATRYPSLADALADTVLSVATTRRHGKYRQEILTPGEVVSELRSATSSNRAAIVFGREDSGLTTDEVSLCRFQATIPSSDAYGSLNLAQAVMVFSYELYCASQSAPGEPAEHLRTSATTAEIEPMFTQMEATLLRIGFLKPENPTHIMRTMRRIFARADLDSREVTVLRGMLSQIDWATTAYQGKKG
jgi:tRNA/rRNA methyltransferase